MVSKVVHAQKRRRLSVEDRRSELLRTCLDLLGKRPWDEVTMADVAEASGVSKPLLYHYFSTKTDLYRATVTAAAEELREATRPDPALPIGPRMRAALDAHLDWIEAHAAAYRAVIQGGISSDPVVQDVVEQSRAESVARLAEAFGADRPTDLERIAFRGWIGFLEWTSLEWLATATITKRQLADLLAASAAGLRDLAHEDRRIRR
jgi:AcrR family transcriptional regulator